MIFARSLVSVWNRIVFSYFATDRDDISSSIAHFGKIIFYLETEDLSGCGKILEQIFKVHLDRNYDHLHVLAFLNGFDVAVVHYGEGVSDFEMEI